MYISFTSVGGDKFTVRKDKIMLFGQDKKKVFIVLEDGNLFDVAMRYEDLFVLMTQE